MRLRVRAFSVLCVVGVVLPAATSIGPTAHADSACSGLTAGYDGPNLHNIHTQNLAAPYAVRGDLRAYNPYVIDRDGNQGLSTAWVMLARRTGDKWAQTGWLKTPRLASPDKYNPLVFMQIRRPGAAVNAWRSPPTIVNPPYMHAYQVSTTRSGYWSFAFNGVEWAHVPTTSPATWNKPNMQQAGGEIRNWYTTQGRGDQMPGDRLSSSKMKVRNVNWASDLAGSWHGSNLNVLAPGRPWFKYYHFDGSNFDIWDERCPN